MATRRQPLWWPFRRRDAAARAEARGSSDLRHGASVATPPVDFAPNDPLLYYLQHAGGVVDVDALQLDSPGLRDLREAGVKLVLPLISQGELIGTVNLGPRLSEQEYSSDDRRLLSDLAAQAAPAVRVAQLARQQQAEARERERLVQELKVASLIQHTLLPKRLPELPGWSVSAYYQPARAVGGDFYDFYPLPEGKLGLVIGDVTDKGVPAALVMATTRAILRGAAARSSSPGTILERTNDLLHPDIPPKMFVTCLCAVIDPATGRIVFANAGHDLPYRRHAAGVQELRATGMPLGLMPGMRYEEREVVLDPTDTVLFYSDGLVEAHAEDRKMFGFPRLMERLAAHEGGPDVVSYLLGELESFTGPSWEQEDDVTLVVVQRTEALADAPPAPAEPASGWTVLDRFELPSEPGRERDAMSRVNDALAHGHVAWSLSDARRKRLETAVAEATMNAIEHGNGNRPEVPVEIEVLASDDAVAVRISDRGGVQPVRAPTVPDLQAKLAGLQSPRGWGLFLIEKMVDEMHVTSDDQRHTVELALFREEKEDGR